MASGARQGFSGTLKRMKIKPLILPVCLSFFAGAMVAGFLAPRADLGAIFAPPPPKIAKVIPVNERIDTPFKPARAGVSRETPVTEAAARRFIDGLGAYIYYDPPHEINDFAFLGPDGQYQKLEDYKGRYVLFNLWATWCGYCLEELPSLGRLQEKAKGSNLDVIAISVESNATISGLKEFLRLRGIGDFALNYDYDRDVQYALPASVLPVTFLVNPEGQVVYSFGGKAEWDSPEAIALLETFIPVNQ